MHQKIELATVVHWQHTSKKQTRSGALATCVKEIKADLKSPVKRTHCQDCTEIEAMKRFASAKQTARKNTAADLQRSNALLTLSWQAAFSVSFDSGSFGCSAEQNGSL